MIILNSFVTIDTTNLRMPQTKGFANRFNNLAIWSIRCRPAKVIAPPGLVAYLYNSKSD